MTTMKEAKAGRGFSGDIVRLKDTKAQPATRYRPLDVLIVRSDDTDITSRVAFYLDHPHAPIWFVQSIHGAVIAHAAMVEEYGFDYPAVRHSNELVAFVAGAVDEYDVLLVLARRFNISINPRNIAESIQGTPLENAAIAAVYTEVQS